ncbi:A24 family peptidase [Limnohabitans sp. T6-20]|jgi:leader peptidase (prepilin peptidase)/N-methyltransferase|uniref:prepilin peptidase n=1 Tax=Limnohabitans sp. T6-20 TaxID=1100725 RepID=UPI000D3822DB|nr:A24 family peptidase [Limnohabitans sp. T6-20]PUE12063.1 prepilin peptidase [Limnohabitans sp. T6-20]
MFTDAFAWGGVALLGLVVGSFLNVVIHRLPRMLEAQWAEALHEQVPDSPPHQPKPQPYNIATPGSHCPHCDHALPWAEKIPVLSYLVLKGRCRQCHAPIGWRYPAIELLTAALFVWSFSRYGLSVQALAWAGFAAALVTLAAIDADTTLLPDAITQPLVWSGLLAASLDLSAVGLSTALWGAVVGYLFLWAVYWLFKWVTGKEGMGQGDFKLLAALGAWLGWPALLSVVLMASLTGVAGGLWLRVRQRLAEDGYIPFGPFLALAGLWVMAFGPLPVLPV